MRRARFVVRGIVQGVNFRNAAVREANARGLTGCVWNRSDDAVELIAEGDPAALDDLATWLAHGPRMAQVERVDRSDLGGERRYTSFRVADAAPE